MEQHKLSLQLHIMYLDQVSLQLDVMYLKQSSMTGNEYICYKYRMLLFTNNELGSSQVTFHTKCT